MSFNSIGADVEVFVTQGSKHKAICGLIGGTKENPLPVDDFSIKGFAVQEDNVSLEFNIPVAYDRNQFVSYIKLMRVLGIPERLTPLGLSVAPESAVSFDKTELTHPNALIFGCEPDYNAWKRVENKKPYTEDECLRTAGGHIHVGSNTPFIQGVQNMDLFLGVPSILLDDNEGSVMRRKLYGKAGAMRPKPYGWEYRVLSNFWIFDEKVTFWVFNNTVEACNFKYKFSKIEANKIQNCINEGDKDAALSIINHYGLTLPT